MPNNIIYTHRFSTPLGDMVACATEQGLCLLEFLNTQRLEREQHDLMRLLNARLLAGENEFIRQTQAELHDYFSGSLKTFSVPLHTPATPFQQKVWDTLQTIPFGQTVSYQEQAERMGRAAAVRAVANANGQNRVSIIIPCHRVIGKDGSLTGYGGGLQRKQWLLAHECGEHIYAADLFSV